MVQCSAAGLQCQHQHTLIRPTLTSATFRSYRQCYAAAGHKGYALKGANLLRQRRPCKQRCPPQRHASQPWCRSGGAPLQVVNPRTQKLRELLKQPTILQGPCCHDALSARLIEQAGFPIALMSGFCTSAVRLGAPDTGLISYGEMVDVGRTMHEATKSLPIIGDGDTGYGNAMNVKRTVQGYAAAGFAGILIEDQVAPKSCGHVGGKQVVGRDEALARIRAAVDARDEGADILIAARSDARQAVSLQEALWRAAAFADAGADILFVDALESVDEMRRFCTTAPGVAKMANNLEGGGQTPLLRPEALQDLGFSLVAYPLSLLGVSVRAMEIALAELKSGGVLAPPALPSFKELQAAVGFPEYFEEAARYAVSTPSPAAPSADLPPAPTQAPEGPTIASTTPAGASSGGGSAASPDDWAAGLGTSIPPAEVAGPAAEAAGSGVSRSATDGASAGKGRPANSGAAAPSGNGTESSAAASGSSSNGCSQQNADVRHSGPAAEPRVAGEGTAAVEPLGISSGPVKVVVEPDAVIEDPMHCGYGSNEAAGGTPYGVPSISDAFQSQDRRALTLRVRITSLANGTVKLETRFPAGFLQGIAAIVPEVSAFDLAGLVQQVTGDKSWDQRQPLVDFEGEGDRVQVFLEAS